MSVSLRTVAVLGKFYSFNKQEQKVKKLNKEHIGKSIRLTKKKEISLKL